MPNAVLDRLLGERQHQVDFIDELLGRVEQEGRDLVDAEQGNLKAARDRITALDNQITPLAEWENLRGAHAETVASLPVGRRGTEPQQMAAGKPPQYSSAGHFLTDLLRARGMMPGQRQPDPDALARTAFVVADQKTGDTPGILPTPIVGQVVNLIDANRPLITSLGGGRAMGGIPGTTFTRPKITQHTTVGAQAGEKTQLPSQKMVVGSVSFTKSTYGGTVDISRQDIDWSSPAAWDILIADLSNVYAVQTETAVAGAFTTAAGANTPIAAPANTLAGWTAALYTAAMHSYQATFRMPDRIWCALNVWAALGSLVDSTRVVLPPDPYTTGTVDQPLDSFDVGGSALGTFRGDVLGLPRIVVPTLAAGTCIVGNSADYEVYEEVIGLLSVVEPSILGVQVAYGGYVAFGAVAGGGLIPITAPAGLPTMLTDAELAAAEAEPATTPKGNGGK